VGCRCVAKDDSNPVAEPSDLLVQVPRPHATAGQKSNDEGHEPHEFRNDHAPHEHHRVAQGQDAVPHPKDAVQQAGATIGRGKDLGGVVEQRAGEMADQQGHQFAREGHHQRGNGHQQTKDNAEGIARLAEMRTLCLGGGLWGVGSA